MSSPHKYLRLIGIVATLTMGIHTFLAPISRRGLSDGEIWPWFLAMSAFLVCFVLTTSQPDVPLRRKRSLCLIGVQTGLALYVNSLLGGNTASAGMLLLVAAQLTPLLSKRLTLVWVTLQSTGLFAVYHHYWNLDDAVAYALGFFYFQMFAGLTMLVALREHRARVKLAQVVEELQTARLMLDETVRQAERLNISRELHDVLGHHLTAISMNLQVAINQHCPELARQHVTRAEEVSRSLLADVRQTVRGLRESADLGLSAELRRVIERMPLQVHLSLPAAFEVSCPTTQHVLVRTVQEILTNAARHGQARQVWLHMQVAGSLLTLYAKDDGQGVADLHPGCGLSGMRERLESVGGRLDIAARRGEGVGLMAAVPWPGR